MGEGKNKNWAVEQWTKIQVGDIFVPSCPPVICLQTYSETCCHLPTSTSIHPILSPWNPWHRTKDPLPILPSSSLLLSLLIPYTHLHSFVTPCEPAEPHPPGASQPQSLTGNQELLRSHLG